MFRRYVLMNALSGGLIRKSSGEVRYFHTRFGAERFRRRNIYRGHVIELLKTQA